jgi:hypothetical protein
MSFVSARSYSSWYPTWSRGPKPLWNKWSITPSALNDLQGMIIGTGEYRVAANIGGLCQGRCRASISLNPET